MGIFSFNAAAIHLAKALYYTRSEAFGIALPCDFDALDVRTKQHYIEQAQTALEAVRPAPDYFALATGLARQQARKVVGSITPETPWGDTAA